MRITICGSLDFTTEMKKIADALDAKGHETVIPHGCRLILSGQKKLEEIRREGSRQKAEAGVIQYYYDEIGKSDAILVANYDKKGIKNYIGGNSFLEIGFAYVLGKKIFLMNPIPEIEYYKTEIEAMKPTVINGDLSRIQ